MKEIFIEKVPSYELREGGNICLPKVKTMRFGTETVRLLGQKLWRSKYPREVQISSQFTKRVVGKIKRIIVPYHCCLSLERFWRK